ncbi:8-oxo-dGTP diphosphatase MutT [Candidatus Enterovibrio escicola]|uniref:8-oxo-dGTP diphosphatase MutT n=1 Tax=Candidatus Enterovibrio escicola TaxID=1927127 RepID=UPI0012381175|nr:8-oxo-dGTP diphosphatase MutT [Candidatus Enterovibrio escacola]
MAEKSKSCVHIAVGIIVNTECSMIFITQRSGKAPNGNLWEFAGGKVEVNETVEQAVYRELKEEVGINVKMAEPFISLIKNCSDKILAVDFFLITSFEGEPFGNEGQIGFWVPVSKLSELKFPEANKPVLDKLVARFCESLN